MGTDTYSSNNRTANSRGIKPEVAVAIVGALATIIVALFSFPPFVELFEPEPTVTPTPPIESTITSVVYTDTASLPTDTPQPIITITFTSIAVTTPVTTDTPSLPIGMHPRLVADRTTGKAPLTVKLDARDSFLRAPGGEVYYCTGGACEYTWEVYSGGQRIGKPVHNSTGTFQYTFGRKGSYVVTVIVCRGGGSSDCNGSGAQIVVN